MVVIKWTWTPPAGVSLVEHAKTLPITMMQAFEGAGRTGLFVVSFEVAAILDMLFVYKSEISPIPGPISRIGRLHGIPVWVNLDNMENEVLVAEDPVDPYPIAKLVINNLINTTILDRLASL